MNYEKLFKHLSDNHDLILLETEMQEISKIVFDTLLKELIEEMKDRGIEFERNAKIAKNYDYWNGKMSEASFVVDKLTNILEGNEQ